MLEHKKEPFLRIFDVIHPTNTRKRKTYKRKEMEYNEKYASIGNEIVNARNIRFHIFAAMNHMHISRKECIHSHLYVCMRSTYAFER